MTVMTAGTFPIAPNPPPDPVPPGDPFIYQTPSYVPAVDGIGGFGMDSGFGFRPWVAGVGASAGTPNWYFVNTNSSNSGTGTLVDTRTYECSLPFAMEHDVSNKVVILLTSGAYDFGATEVNCRGDNVTLVGHTVRAGTGYGAYWRGRNPLYCRGNHVHIQGMRFFQDAGGTSPIGALRDNLDLGWPPGTGYLLASGCEFHGGIDECLSFYDAIGVCSVVESAICAPLEGTAISEDLSHNLAVICGYNVNKFSLLRCAMFHAAQRLPLSYSRYTALANMLVYNPADGRGNNSQGTQIDRHPSDPASETHHAAIVNSCFLNGPQGYSANWPITSQGPLIAGSEIYAAGNVQRGYSNVTTQDTFLGTQTDFNARQWRVTTPPASTMPASWGSSHENIDTITDSTAGILAFIAKLRAGCGVQPKDPGISVLSGFFTQAENYVNSTGSGYGAVSQSQSYPSATSFTIIPSNSSHVTAYWGGNSLPSVADRDTINANGVSNGEAWVRAIRRIHYGT